MIYLDTSVALAHLLGETRRPSEELWQETLVASRLLEYELWCRLHARALGSSHADEARQLLGQVALVELAAPVLARALQPFPVGMRTLDAMHLATVDFLRAQGQEIRLASYDDRLSSAASALGVPLWAERTDRRPQCTRSSSFPRIPGRSTTPAASRASRISGRPVRL